LHQPAAAAFLAIIAVANMEKPLDMGNNYYVPRDESFHEVKQESFITNSLKGVVRQSVPLLTNSLKAECENFECFHAIDRLYQEGVKLRDFQNVENGILKRLPMSQAMKTIEDSTNTVTNMFQYSEPTILSSN
jgi:lipoxygenase